MPRCRRPSSLNSPQRMSVPFSSDAPGQFPAAGRIHFRASTGRPCRVMPATKVDCRSGAASSESFIQAGNQSLIVERLGQKSDRTCGQRLCPRCHLGKGCNKNDGQAVPLRNQSILQFYSGHARHLHVSNQAVRVTDTVRPQERFSGVKCGRSIAKRSYKTCCSSAERVVVVNNCDHGHLRQVGLPR